MVSFENGDLSAPGADDQPTGDRQQEDKLTLREWHCRIRVVGAEGEDMDTLQCSQVGCVAVVPETAIETSPPPELLEGEPGRAGGVTAASDRFRRQAIAIFNHNLRAPLTYVLGYTSLLAQRAEEGRERLIQSALRHTLSLREVLDDLAPVIEWTSLCLQADGRPADLCRVVSAVVSRAVLEAVEKGQRIDVSVPPGSLPVAVDAWGAGTVLTLLLVNALKHTAAGETLSVALEREGDWAVVRISAREESSPAVPSQPSGIGLATIQVLAEALGGQLDIHCAGDEGVQFHLFLPLWEE